MASAQYNRYIWLVDTIDAKYGRAQHPVGNGLYVLTHSSTAAKKQQLDRISKALHLGWKVEIIG